MSDSLFDNHIGGEAALRLYFPFGFPVGRELWTRYALAELVALEPGQAPPGIHSLRLLVHRMNARRLEARPALPPLGAGQILAAGVIVDVLRYVLEWYCHRDNPGMLRRGLQWIGQEQGPAVAEAPVLVFPEFFPAAAVALGRLSPAEYLARAFPTSVGQQAEAAEIVTGEMILLALSLENPAFQPFQELFEDTALREECAYVELVRGLEEFGKKEPPFAPLGLPLFECLRAPMRAAPESLEGQLEYIRRHWAHFLPAGLRERVMRAADVVREEQLLRGLGPGAVPVLRFERRGEEEEEPEIAAFSPDADWMSNQVLIAKSTHVWLDQLSKQYQRPIRLLSDIPEEELDRLAGWGFSGLWLIGVWERSPASERIKKMMGNPEAAASAYSIYDYTIAYELGGEEALEVLQQRAAGRGIRLAADMVPNHTGLYSRWIREHPAWFLQLAEPPYPWYQFRGPDLSEDPDICLQIEDGYWERRDAAVVFRYYDRRTGEVRYIYHGNDGTSMPWNDTAQLNFLLPEVREAVIQTILRLARRFPVIRFDAAMTLSKRHYQRLWFPRPGEGGAIPSRAERGMTREEFDRAMPVEFWREVVDRVAREAPDTLLLAEAFWLMEGYFVRTLGMHRVYNSAFMNMLKREDNANYRQTVKNVLEFSPEVLKRFVNFMNNPDEETAVVQFGKGDKYFGVCTMMVTMPGLPMFGHGQVEGLAEKYGMEYRKTYWDERPDEELIRRHEREIFPLLRRRWLFSGADNFAFYDFVTPDGWVDENVFAYSNRAGPARALVFYNNAYQTTRGRIRLSTAINVGPSEAPVLIRRSLAEALALNSAPSVYYAFREHPGGLEYLRCGQELAEHGFELELGGYQYRVFLDFRELHDADGLWARVHERLAGSAVPSLDEVRRALELEPITLPFRQCLSSEVLQSLVEGRSELPASFFSALSALLEAAARLAGAARDHEPLREKMEAAFQLISRFTVEEMRGMPGGIASFKPVLAALSLLLTLAEMAAAEDRRDIFSRALSRLHDWMLEDALRQALQTYCGNALFAQYDALLVKVALRHRDLLRAGAEPGELASRWQAALADPDLSAYLQTNYYEGRTWIRQEQLERFLAGVLLLERLRRGAIKEGDEGAAEKRARQILAAARTANYAGEEMLALLERESPPGEGKGGSPGPPLGSP